MTIENILFGVLLIVGLYLVYDMISDKSGVEETEEDNKKGFNGGFSDGFK